MDDLRRWMKKEDGRRYDLIKIDLKGTYYLMRGKPIALGTITKKIRLRNTSHIGCCLVIIGLWRDLKAVE